MHEHFILFRASTGHDGGVADHYALFHTALTILRLSQVGVELPSLGIGLRIWPIMINNK